MEQNLGNGLDRLTDKTSSWAEGLMNMLPNIMVAVLVFLIFYLIGKVLKRLLRKPINRVSETQSLVNLFLNIIFIVVVLTGLFISLSVLKLDKAVTSLLAGAGILGIALGFAFQDIASNFIAGILVSVQKPIKIGEIVESNGYFGNIHDINLRTTVIRTFQGQHVFIPNKDLYSSPIINYTREGKRRVDLACGVSYGEDLEKVEQVSKTAIEEFDFLVESEGVQVCFSEFGSSSINFTVRYWIDYTKQPVYITALSDGVKKLKKAFDENDIMIPFPIRTLDFGIKGGEKMKEQLSEVMQASRDQGQ